MKTKSQLMDLKDSVMAASLKTKSEKSKLAQAMIAPISRRLNYSSIAKSMFKSIEMIFEHEGYRVYLDEENFLVTFQNNEVMKVSFDFESILGLENNPIRDELLDMIKTYQVINE